MIRVTWAWLGESHALDLANTIAIEHGLERDLLAPDRAFDQWAEAEAHALHLGQEEGVDLVEGRAAILTLRTPVREVFSALATGSTLPGSAIHALNIASRADPEWVELDEKSGRLITRHAGTASARVAAAYARSALEAVGRGRDQPVRICGAPSCGMFYRPSRARQVWCSTQCGTRARVARAYRARA